MTFLPDFGLRLMQDGLTEGYGLIFFDCQIVGIDIIGDGHYSTSIVYPYGGENHALSLDFGKSHLHEILTKATVNTATRIYQQIAQDPCTPRQLDFDNPLDFAFSARLGKPERCAEETFVPLLLQEILAGNNIGDAAITKSNESFSKEEFDVLIETATWSDVNSLIKIGIDSKISISYLITKLNTDRKQSIEIICSILTAIKAVQSTEAIIQMMIAQAESSNAIRGRNALIQLGTDCAMGILSHIETKNWQVRQYLVQCLGIYRIQALVPTLELISVTDKSKKVKETALQAIKYTHGQISLSECSCLPSPDDRECKLGVTDKNY